jgi:hypothetical protein
MDEFVRNVDGRIKIDIEYKEDEYIKNKFGFIKENNE